MEDEIEVRSSKVQGKEGELIIYLLKLNPTFIKLGNL